MLTDGRPAGPLAASTKLEKVRANTMTMKERLKIHREMEEKNRQRIRDHIARQKKSV